MRSTCRRLAAPFLVLLTIVSACHDGGPLDPGSDDHRLSTLRVMTRNLYIGGDIGPVFQADFSNPVAVLQASAAVWAQIQGTDFTSRVERLADEIASRKPHVVGLQEAFRFIRLDGSFQPVDVLDYIDLLEAELSSRGLTYDVVAIQENTQAALPLSVDATGQVEAYVQFTDRIAVLARGDVDVTGMDQGQYQAAYALGPIQLSRGWIRATLDVGRTTVHVVNTHFEGQSLAPIQAAQLAELQGAVLPGLDGVTLLMGDLNSDAEAGPGAPSWTPSYDALTADGFLDLWDEAVHPHNPVGFTCCHDPDLRNASAQLDERIDFVLFRGDEARLGPIFAELVGEERGDRTTDGLWPSDHAGLIMQIGLWRHPAGR